MKDKICYITIKENEKPYGFFSFEKENITMEENDGKMKYKLAKH